MSIQSSSSKFIQGQYISTVGTSSNPYNGLWPSNSATGPGYIMEWPLREGIDSFVSLAKENDIYQILCKILSNKFEQKANEKAINFVLLKGSIEEIMQLMPGLSAASVRFSQKSKANRIILDKLKEKINDSKIVDIFIKNYTNSCIDDVEVFKIALDNKNTNLILSTLCRDDVTEYIRENNLSIEVDDLFIKNDPKDLFQYFMFSETFDKKRFYKHFVSFNNDNLLSLFINNFYPEMRKKQEMLR